MSAGPMRSHSCMTCDAIREFVLAGDAILTLRSVRTGAHLTFRFRQAEDDPSRFFVKLLTGPDNGSDFTYLGMVTRESEAIRFRLTKKSRMNDESPPVRAVRYLLGSVFDLGRVPTDLEVRHEGRCGRCARRLTVPESIERGIGPDCAQMMEHAA